MNPEPPLFVSRLDPHIPPRVQRLRRLDVPHFTADDKREATAVLAEALHGILDTVFTHLLLDIEDSYGEPGGHTRALKSAHDTIGDVKYRIDQRTDLVEASLGDLPARFEQNRNVERR